MSEILELKDILELGNDGAPEEWLANLTGEGIGGGNEGIDDDIINASVKALISSVNRYERCEDGKED